MDNFNQFYKIFSRFSKEFNHKNSYIKEQILSVLYLSEKHLSANEIQEVFKQRYKKTISLTAIYDLLNFINECGLTNSYDVNGVKKYELNLKNHHDHIICESCGKVVVFYDENIENRQYEICDSKNFILKDHTMILYGICADCQNKYDNDKQKALSLA